MANNYYDGNNDYSYDNRYSATQTRTSQQSTITRSAFIGRSFGYMTVGLVLSFITAFFASTFFFEIFSLGFMLFLLVAQIGCTLAFSLTINKASYSTTLVLFIVNALLLGVSISSIFIVYELGDIYLAFAISAVLFLAMALIGSFTKVDFSKISSLLLACFIGIIVAGLIGFFVGGIFSAIVCILGIVLFMGVTIIDVARMNSFYSMSVGTDRVRQYAMYCAFQLYLDFINIFLRVLSLIARYAKNK